MRNAPLSLLVFVCAFATSAGVQLTSQAPPPAPPAAKPAAPALPVPPAPISTPPEDLPKFQVASVKKSEGKGTSTSLRTPGGGRLMLTNVPLRTIVMQAFGGLRDYQMSGGPGWMTMDRFTINAKAETNAPRDQVMLMLRSLLVERFQFKYHAEKREMQAYVLTTAEKEWKPTARMKPVDCNVGRGVPPPTAPTRIDQLPPCMGGTMLSTGGIQARGVTMASFVSLLSSLGGLGLIHDRTGLTGNYNIELDASPTALLRASSLASSLNPTSENLLPNVGEGRSLSAAVSDLGLKLERRKEPVEVLVIDSVSQPDED